MSDYIVLRDGKVVQSISNMNYGADGAYALVEQEGDLYVRCGPPSKTKEFMIQVMQETTNGN